MYFTRFWKYILFYTADAFIILAWCLALALVVLVLTWLIRSAWSGLKSAALDIIQLIASYRNQQLDLIERKVRIAVTAAPYLGEVQELRLVLAELEKDKEPALTVAFSIMKRIKSLPQTPTVASLRDRTAKVIVADNDP